MDLSTPLAVGVYNRNLFTFRRRTGCGYFLFAKYSRTIILINPLTEVPFSSAIVLSFSMTSGEKNTFVRSEFAFGLADIITPPSRL